MVGGRHARTKREMYPLPSIRVEKWVERIRARRRSFRLGGQGEGRLVHRRPRGLYFHQGPGYGGGDGVLRFVHALENIPEMWSKTTAVRGRQKMKIDLRVDRMYVLRNSISDLPNGLPPFQGRSPQTRLTSSI